jgi:hypothetical protein
MYDRHYILYTVVADQISPLLFFVCVRARTERERYCFDAS